MMKISDFTEGRDNNFNLIRMIAALAVLISHSHPLTGTYDAFPDIFGLSFGSIAVDVFFIVSGFLVTASLLKSRDGIDFFWARVLRVYPALIVMLLITVFGLGLFFTTLPMSAYLADHITHKYFISCATLIANVTHELPGVFENNPHKSTVNGSLWSLPYEIRLYILLFTLWFLGGFVAGCKSRIVKVFLVVIFFTPIIAVVYKYIYVPKHHEIQKAFFMFFVGSIFFIFRSKIPLSHYIFIPIAIALSISAINKDIFLNVYYLLFPYIVFYLAYIPSGVVRKYNDIGDYSYGLYIYAFPVQQTIAALVPGVGFLAMTWMSSLVTIVFAILSWHLIEKRMLGLKSNCVNSTRKLFSIFHRRHVATGS